MLALWGMDGAEVLFGPDNENVEGRKPVISRVSAFFRAKGATNSATKIQVVILVGTDSYIFA